MPGPAVIWVLEKSVDDPKTYHLSMRLGKRLPRKWPKRVEEEEIATLAITRRRWKMMGKMMEDM